MSEETVCFNCDAWVYGGMCRRVRISKHNVVNIAVKLSDPLENGHDYLYPAADFACRVFSERAGPVKLSPGGFVFGSPWNMNIDGEARFFQLNVPDSSRAELFRLCDYLNEHLGKRESSTRNCPVRDGSSGDDTEKGEK